MINKDFLYAIIWASTNPEKYGYKVFKDLLDAGYKVIPINPAEKEILWKKTYPRLSVSKKKIDVAIFVTQPTITENILKEVKILKIKKVWLQPGAQSNKAIKFCEKNNIECIHNACIMIQKNI